VFDLAGARSLADLLKAEMISVRVKPGSEIGAGATTPWMILVSGEQLEAARGLITRSQFTNTELTFLATGELGGIETKWLGRRSEFCKLPVASNCNGSIPPGP
jgi:hypothetical protein